MTIQELMEKRAKVWEAAKNFVDTHENENGVLSAEDSATYERMESEIEATSVRFPIPFRRAWMPTAVIWFRRSMTEGWLMF